MENSYIPFATFPWLSVGNLEQSKFNYFKRVSYHHHREPPQLYAGAGDPRAGRAAAGGAKQPPAAGAIGELCANRAIVDFSEIYQNTSKYNVKHITRR